LPHTRKTVTARFESTTLQALYLLACKNAVSVRSFKNTDFSTFISNCQLYD
jgi:hypothetical protein